LILIINHLIRLLPCQKRRLRATQHPCGVTPSSTWFHRVGRLGVVMMLCGLLGACSMVQTAYNQSHELAYWWIDGYVDVSSEQRPLLHEELMRYQRWHRQTQLPRYQGWLQQLQTLAAQDVTSAQACLLYDQVWNSLPVLVQQTEAAASALARSLGAEQIAHLARKMDRQHRDWRQEWIEAPAAEVLDKRVQRAQERAEDFYGRLDATQRLMLRQQAEQSPYDATLSEAMRLRRRQDIVDTLQRLQRQSSSPEDATHIVRQLLQRSLISPDPVHQDYVRRLNEYNCRAMARLHNSTSPGQRQSALKRLQKYERDVRELMARP
jgi:hypothetical protein